MECFKYEATDKPCKRCQTTLVEYFWFDHRPALRRSGLYCPHCRMKRRRKMRPDEKWLPLVMYIMDSEVKTFSRQLEEHEIIKLGGVMAWWFAVGRKIFIAPKYPVGGELQKFKDCYQTSENILVYLPNNYLQRLYFMIPRDAIR